jgi:uncharacterized membrane protein SpoIIM required for sporulation
MQKRNNKIRCFNKSVNCIYLIGIIIGIVISFFILPESNGKNNFLNLSNTNIIARNLMVLFVIYISSVVSKMIFKFIILKNGFVLGITLGWIFIINYKLLIFIIPHGIFEIPCFLSTGYLLNDGETLFKNNPLKLLKYLVVHVFFIIIIGLIEKYFTTTFRI